MTLNISTIQSAVLGGTAKFERWKERYEAQMYAPMVNALAKQLADMLPEEERQKLKAEKPDIYKSIYRGGA